MRRVHLLAATGAVLVPVLFTSGCADRPNDLDTYYDDPPAAAPAAPSAPATPPPAPSSSAAAPSTPAPDAAGLLRRGALTAPDLASQEVTEGASADEVQAVLTDCAVPLTGATDGRTTGWSYASGSTLSQYLAVFPEGAAAVVDAVDEGLGCPTYDRDGATYRVDRAFTVDQLTGVDAQLSWCSRGPKTTCTLLVAKDTVLTSVAVTAGTQSRAQKAVTEVAPLAATALERISRP